MKFSFPLFLILNIFSSGIFAQTTYYIDATGGNDSWSGTSQVTAWQTLSKVNSTAFQPGDSILFKRGESWRRQLIPVSGSSVAVVYYGAYGSGTLPMILGSENMNQNTDWVQESANIWLCTTLAPTDVGNIIFDNEDHAGIKKWSLGELQNQDDFFYDLNTGELRMYSTDNPAIVHSVIECALREHVVDQNYKEYITYENLAIKYGAANGFGGKSTSHITIKNCEISWIGGGDLDLDGQIRYGNAVGFFLNASDNLVENNKIWEIYDTGVTNQGKTPCVQQNIIYRNNIIWNCGMAAVEIWNRDSTSIMQNIVFENNTCVNIGYGWGLQRPDYMGFCHAAWSNYAQTDSVFIRNNIFVNPLRAFHVISETASFNIINRDYNCYYADSPADTFFANYETFEVITMQDFNVYQTNTNDEWNSILAYPNFNDSANNDYHLNGSSACVDAGINTGLNYDHDGISRPQGSGYDIGAYEFFSTGIIENEETIFVYPNPASEIISVSGIEDGNIDVFTLGGKFIESQTGNSINVSNYQPGIYILVFQSENKNTKLKIIVN